MRCMLRHTTSGSEAYIQGGLNLRAFVKDCLLGELETSSASTESLSPMEAEQVKDDEQEHLNQ